MGVHPTQADGGDCRQITLRAVVAVPAAHVHRRLHGIGCAARTPAMGWALTPRTSLGLAAGPELAPSPGLAQLAGAMHGEW